MSRRPHRFEFERDERGYPRARWFGPSPESEPTALLHFLESDLGFDSTYCARILEEGEQARLGQSRGWRVAGNAFSLFVGPKETIITPLYGHPRIPVELPTEEFLDLVKRWHALISDPETHQDETGPA